MDKKIRYSRITGEPIPMCELPNCDRPIYEFGRCFAHMKTAKQLEKEGKIRRSSIPGFTIG